LVLVDLALDYPEARRVALAAADQASSDDLETTVGLFQSLGKSVSVLDDVPGMIVMRTVCMLANEGADAVYHRVCSAEAVDTAMQGGVNYPLGPMAWAERIGVERIVAVLDNMASIYGEDRYRVSPLLRRRMFSGSGLL
jgi:3-hydroxybutyryl-CoA dehydrogenase